MDYEQTVQAFERTVRAQARDDWEVIGRLYEEAKRWSANRRLHDAFQRRARQLWVQLPLPMMEQEISPKS